MARITVSGVAIERAPAERASVAVRSVHRGASADEAIRVVGEAHRGLVDEAAAHVASGAAERWRADRLHVAHHEEWMGDGLPRETVFEAAASVHVEFVDAEAMGTWLGALAARPEHEIGDVRWTLTDETSRTLASRARAGAVADALRSAADLAEAAGLGAPTVVAIREGEGADEPGPSPRMAMTMQAASAGSGAPIALDGGEIAVASTVRIDLEA